MTLYDKTFARYYDTIFPPKDTTIKFLKHHLPKRGHIADFGCGTGNYALALGDLHFTVEASDLSHDMVALAKEKNKVEHVTFAEKNMLDLNETAVYDGIIILGNTLVHLSNEAEIKTMIDKCYQALKPEGKLIISVINYIRILEKEIYTLPTISNDDVIFMRDYNLIDDKIEFKTTLNVNQHSYKDTTILYPITATKLIDFYKAIGFQDIRTYGDYKESDFSTDQSMHCIIEGTRL